METTNEQQTALVLSQEQLLAHWQGHRSLTRRVIEAFPEHEFYHYAIGGMRPFAEMAHELLQIAVPGVQGMITGNWDEASNAYNQIVLPATKAEILALWDEATTQLDTLFPQIPASRFQEENLVFNQYSGPTYSSLFYFIDNEIHHRAQGYVYLRSLGIQPPFFWDR